MPRRIGELTETGIIAEMRAELRRLLRGTAAVQSPLGEYNEYTLTSSTDSAHTLTYIPSLSLIPIACLNGLPGRYGADYTVDFTTGIVTWSATKVTGDILSVFYQTTGDLIALSGPADTGGGITDTFNRADNVSLGTTSDGNATWTQQHGFGGTIGIVGNKARLPTATTGERFATVPSGTAGSVQVDVPDSTNASRPAGLTFRYIDSTHFWYVFVNGTSLKVNDPSGSAFVGAGAAGDTLRVDYTTTGFQVFQNGALVYTRTDSTFNTSTAVGIYVNNGDGIGGGSVDNFSYVSA